MNPSAMFKFRRLMSELERFHKAFFIDEACNE